MAIGADIVLLRKRPIGLPAKSGSLEGIEQTQKHFLRKTRQGRVQKGDSPAGLGSQNVSMVSSSDILHSL